MTQDRGASVGPGSSASTEPQSSLGLGRSGFDPSRVLAQMRYYFENAKACGWTPVRWHISESLHRDLSAEEARRAEIMGLPITVRDEWSWGWMMTAKPAHWAFDSTSTFWEPRDRDGSPEGRDAQRLDGTAATARAARHRPSDSPAPIEKEG